ncbi:MAG: UDP-N-acetylmuramoyl-L-alanine--D-glutamate ligase [Gammaproteobacteria bacterium]|nr:UDP-N-acetylmuramoyl-L-alanine--D-glutamate ligase [Gammaproteobacteria bacterium]MCH9744736.1 UDP-N-acetylmuramoyl-L-alanine--D-glutamate ligase [Gammaproteobacteria bacterium]
MKKNVVVIGLGKTGYSCVEYLLQQGCEVCVMDNQQQPPLLNELQQHYPDVDIQLGEFSLERLQQADEIVMSPGVSVHQPIFQQILQQGKSIIGDVELFLREAKAPIIAITGSNGKTTVTTLVGEMLQQAGKNAIVCGNIGAPVLEQLQQPTPDFYVLELSSFQLELIHSLTAKVAVLLNICQDHMDRYKTLADYLKAKQRIYKNCESAVINADEPQCWRGLALPHKVYSFGLETKNNNAFYLEKKQDQFFLAFQGKQLLNTNDMLLQGLHHWQNALVALAIGFAVNISIQPMLETLRTFEGLPHRCQQVSNYKGVRWINDSKGTNVGACIAAINSYAGVGSGRLLLIAGGDAKQADLSALRDCVADKVTRVFLLGKDADVFEQTFKGIGELVRVDGLNEAVSQAAEFSQAGDVVLLSPACASWDMFDNYQQRGDKFVEAIGELQGE